MSRAKTLTINDKLLIGSSEWCRLPLLKIPLINAKIDTGARTSALHAFNIKPYIRNGQEYVSFNTYPIQGDDKTVVLSSARVIDNRAIMSSNGHKEHRYVINTMLEINGLQWSIELTLSNRDPLRFRMLLGREALNHRVLIDPCIVHNQGKHSKSAVLDTYK